jgi:hypothetical protein
MMTILCFVKFFQQKEIPSVLLLIIIVQHNFLPSVDVQVIKMEKIWYVIVSYCKNYVSKIVESFLLYIKLAGLLLGWMQSMMSKNFWAYRRRINQAWVRFAEYILLFINIVSSGNSDTFIKFLFEEKLFLR